MAAPWTTGVGLLFSGSRHIRAEQEIYSSTCKCTQRIEAGRAALHASLERVLVIDIRFRWNGLGNSLERWERLLRVGLAAGRATFLYMSDRANPYFDLGEYFVAKGADWHWSSETRLRVAAAMARRNVSGPESAVWSCRKATHTCIRPQLQRSGGRDSITAHLELEQDGLMIAWLRQQAAPWLELRISGDHQIAFDASHAIAAAILAGPSPGQARRWRKQCRTKGRARAPARPTWRRRGRCQAGALGCARAAE